MASYDRKIRLKSIVDVYDFINMVSRIDCDMDLLAEGSRYIVDAKSPLGVFSLDLSKDLILRVMCDEQGMRDRVDDVIEKIGCAV